MIRTRNSILFGAVMIAILSLLLGSAASAEAFGATARAFVRGDCTRTGPIQDNGGGLVTAAQASAAATGGTGLDCPFYTGGGWTGIANTFSDLGTGQLKAFATSESPQPTIGLRHFFNNFGAPVNVQTGAT